MARQQYFLMLMIPRLEISSRIARLLDHNNNVDRRLEIANTGVTSTPANNATNVSPSDPLVLRFATVSNRQQIENTLALIPGTVSNNVAGLQTLNLTSMCNGRWRVRNPNANATLVFTWDIAGKTERGSGIVPGGKDVFFNTSVGSNTVRIYVNGRLNNTKATNPANCSGSTPKVPGAIGGSVGWNTAGTELTFTPSAPLEENKPYTLFVGLNSPYAATFTTGSAVTVPLDGEFSAVVANGFTGVSFSRIGGNTPVELSATEPQWDAGSKVFSFKFSAKNLGTEGFSNLRLILSSFLPDTVTAVSPSGYTADNKPFFDIGAVAAGETKTVTWRFSSPSGNAFRFNLTPLRTQTDITLTQASPAQFRNDVAQTLTLRGTGFRAETAFFVESTKLDVVNWTATQATVRLPAGFMPATYGMMAVNPDGNKATLYPAFTVKAGAPAPLVDQRLNPFSYVEGLVIDYETKQPIANADVSFPGFRAKTDSSGWFFVRGVPRGRHNVLIEASGYEPVYRIAEVTGTQQTVTLHLSELERKDPNISYIGPTGGTHRANNGSFLVIPEGALDQTVPIRFTHTRGATTLPQLPQDGYYLAFARLEPVGLHFKKPATLFLPLQEGMVLPENQPIRISYYEPHQQKWVQDITAGVIKKIEGRLYLEYEINHFTWIGGQWVSAPTSGCVKHADGSPAPRIPTNFGVTDANGNFSGSIPISRAPGTITANATDYDGSQKSVSAPYDPDASSHSFGNCITLSSNPPAPNPGEPTPGQTSSETGGGCVRPNSLYLGRQNGTGKMLIVAREGATQISSSIPNVGRGRIDLSTLRFSLNGTDYTSQTIVDDPGSDSARYTLTLNQPLRAGLNQEFKVSVSNRVGTSGETVQKADLIAGFRVSPVVTKEFTAQDEIDYTAIEYNDQDEPVGISPNWFETPATTFAQGVVAVVYRSGETLQNHTAVIPVIAVDEQGNAVQINDYSLKFDDSNWDGSISEVGNMSNGVALVPLKLNSSNPSSLRLNNSRLLIGSQNSTPQSKNVDRQQLIFCPGFGLPPVAPLGRGGQGSGYFPSLEEINQQIRDYIREAPENFQRNIQPYKDNWDLAADYISDSFDNARSAFDDLVSQARGLSPEQRAENQAQRKARREQEAKDAYYPRMNVGAPPPPGGNEPQNKCNDPDSVGGVYRIVFQGKVVRTGKASNLVSRKSDYFARDELSRGVPNPLKGQTFDFQILTRTDSELVQKGLEMKAYWDNPTAAKENGGLNRIKPINFNNPESKWEPALEAAAECFEP